MNYPRFAIRHGGFSLLEGLTTLLIVSLLISFGTPSFSRSIEKTRTNSHVSALVATLNLARLYAITENSTTTLCASATGSQCGGYWEQGRLLFIDKNNNRKLDNDEYIIERGHALSDGVRIQWQASGGRNEYIRFSRHGAAMEFGRFTYCPKSNSEQAASMLILNRMGRVRVARDANGDGIVEDANGRQAHC